MAKLTDDMLRFIIDLDAQGAQGELNTLSKDINDLEKANLSMQRANRETEKEMRSLEKQLKQLEKQGKQNTGQYQRLSKQLQDSRDSVSQFNTQIADNTKKIEQNKRQQDQLLQSLKTEDMTMNQLRQRASQLQKQLDNTSKSANPKEFQQLQKELNETKNRMGDLQGKNKTLVEQMQLMPGSLGSISKGVKGLAAQLKVMVATNPLLLAIAAAVGAMKLAFDGLKTAIAGSNAATTRLNAVMAALGSVMDSVKRMTTQVAGALWDLWTRDWSGMKEHLKNTKNIASGMRDAAKSAYDAAISEDALNNTINRQNDLMKVNTARIEELRQKAQDQTKSDEERQRAYQEVLRLQKENYDMQIKNITGTYDVWKQKNAELIKAFQRSNGAAFGEVESLMQKIKQGAELSFEEELRLINAANDIARDTDNATEEQKKQYRQFFTDMLDQERQYFQSSRRDRKQASALRKQDADAEQKDAAKAQAELEKAEQQRLKDDLNNANEFYKEQLLQLKQQYADRQLTDEQYQQAALQAQRDYLNRAIEISREAGADTTQLESQMADLRININKQADQQIAELRKKQQQQIKDEGKQTIEQLNLLQQQMQQTAGLMSGTLAGQISSNIASAIGGIETMLKTLDDDSKSTAERAGAVIAGIGSTVGNAMSAVSEITKAAFELETNSLEAEKQKQLTIAGDNADERARIEEEYEQKALDLKKRQADADAAIQSTQLWVSTAMGIANAWATAMQFGPVAGPIMGAAMTTMLLAMAALQQANILKQREVIKNTTLNHASSGASNQSATAAQSAGTLTSTQNAYTLKKEYSGTGEGYMSGGYTGDGGVSEIAGVVHRGEYVVPQAELHNPVVVPMLRRIEAIRQQRLAGYRQPKTVGFQDGGFTDENDSLLVGGSQSLNQAIRQLNALLRQLQQQPLRAEVNYQQFDRAQRTMQQLKTM